MFVLEKALTGGKKYWLWLAALALVAAAGLAAWFRQLDTGLAITGLSRDVSWGLYIGQFTFLVGVAASAVMVVLPYYLHDWKAFGKITILGEFLAISAVVMCMLFIFVDMGQPSRVFNMILYASPGSIMFWDMISLGGYLLLNVVISVVAIHSEQKETPPPAWIKPVIVLSIPWAVSIHTVTAFLYSGLAGRPFWMTAIMAPRFLASAFASGPALLILLTLAIGRITRSDFAAEARPKLATIVTYAMLANVFFICMELFTAFYSGIPEHIEHFHYLFAGIPSMWVSAALAVVSAALLVLRKWLPAACAMVFVSLWIDKGLGLIVAGFVPSPMGAVTQYTPTAPEILIAAGIWAVGMLMITVFYKIVLSLRGLLGVSA